MSQKLIFVNVDKRNRAEEIYKMLLGQSTKEKYSHEHIAHQKEVFTAMLAEEKIDIKDKDATILFIYKKMAGLVRTVEQEAKMELLKKGRKKTANLKKAKDEDEDDADGKDEEDEDDDDR